MKKLIEWYSTTSLYLGVPVLFFVLIWAVQKTFFTAACSIASYKCEYGFGADQAMADYMGNLLVSNPHTDIVAKRNTVR